ncbi:MAG: fibronectin type III domain-containing protein [Candidatus Thermoplasmatota archaeon]
MSTSHAARSFALFYLVSLAIPALIGQTPVAEASHSGTPNADAFNGRLVYLSGTGLAQSLSSDGNWRDGSGTTYTRIGASNNQANTCGAAQSTASPAQQNIWFVKDNATSNPTVNRTNQENRTIDNLFVRGHRISSGSNQHCGYFYGIAPDQSTLVFIGACGNIGGGNSANGEAYNECNFVISNQAFSGIRIFVATQYCCSNTPWVEIAELQGNGFDMTPPTTAPGGLSASPAGCAASVSWDQTADTQGYYLYRGESPGFAATPSMRIATLTGATSTGHTDSSTVPDKTYYYRVSAYNQDGEGPASAEASITTGLCDGTGRGIIGYDGHMGPNLLTLPGVSTAYTTTPAWAFTSTLAYCEPEPDFRNALACVTDGYYQSGVDFNSFGQYPKSTTCETDGWIEWTWSAPRNVSTLYLSAKTYANANSATFAGCLRVETKNLDGSYTEAKTWTGLGHGVRNDLWWNMTARSSVGIRLRVGDVNSGSSFPSSGATVHELDVYDTNETHYPYVRSLADTVARYSVPITDRTSLGSTAYQGKPFQLGNGVWYAYMLEPRNLSSGIQNRWTFSAPGGGFSTTRILTGIAAPSWEYPADTFPAKVCIASFYQITISGGSRSVTPQTTYPVNTDTEMCRLTGTSFIPSAYQFGDYKIKADLTARGMGTGEEVGRVYLSNAFPFYPALDSDVSTVSFIKDTNFTIGPTLFATGSPGEHGVLSLADYPYGFAGNGLFIALGQDATGDSTLSSTNFEVLLNGRPMSVVYNGKSAQYEYAILYVDDQARRRNLTEPDSSDVLEGNRRVHGQPFESYDFYVKKGFRADMPIRVMRSFGAEGHSVITCRDFCYANVRLEAFKLSRDNQNHINLTVLDKDNHPLQSARVTDNVTGQFYFTDANGRIDLVDRYLDTLFVVTKTGYYSKCLGYAYVTAEGQSMETVSERCGNSEAYPRVRAQNLVYTIILYTIPPVETSTTTFNEVPVEVVTKPVQGIVFRGNFTRIVADQVSIQVQRNVSEDLRLTVFRYDGRTGTLARITDPLDWPANSPANPLLVTYPGGRNTTNDDEGAYHLMVQRGSTYVTGVGFKILADWSHLNAIATPGEIPQDFGDELAADVTTETQEAAIAGHQAALDRAAGSVDTGSALGEAALFVPLILLLLFVGLLLRNMT